MERDYFLDAQQALEMGLVDKVLTSREEQDEVMKPVTDAGKKDDDEGGSGGESSGNGGGKGGGDEQPPSPAMNPSPS